MKLFARYFFIIMVAVSIGTADAHDADGGLPSWATSSNLWVVSCSDDGNGKPVNLEVSLLNNTANGPMVSLQVITVESKPRFFNIADAVGGDGLSTPQISTDWGGMHYILVNKSGYGEVGYHFTGHCMSVDDHTGTDIQQYR